MWASSICLAMAPTFQSPQLWGLDHCLTQECPASENMDLLLLTEVSFIFLFCLVKTCLWGKARLRHCARVHACSVISVVSNSSQPYGLWPARLLCPWDSPGKNIGVGCHAFLQGVFLTYRSLQTIVMLIHQMQKESICILHPTSLPKGQS